MPARQDRQPDHVYVLVDRGLRDHLRRQPDALVHDLVPGVSRAHGDLLRAVGVPVQPGLPYEHPQPLHAERLRHARNALAHLGQLGVAVTRLRRRRHAGRRAEFSEHLAQRVGPLPRGHACARSLDRHRHQVFPFASSLPQRVERTRSRSRVARPPE